MYIHIMFKYKRKQHTFSLGPWLRETAVREGQHQVDPRQRVHVEGEDAALRRDG